MIYYCKKMKLTKTIYFLDLDNTNQRFLVGKQLAVLADFHDSDPGPILDILRNDIPDVIMIPGDLVLGYFPGDDELVINRCRNIMPLLEGCCELAPTYMSIGNHECMLCDDEFDKLRETGVVIVDNVWTELRLPDGQICEKKSEDSSDRVLVGGLTSAHSLSYNRFRDEYNSEDNKEKYERYPYRSKPKDISEYPAESSWLDGFEKEDGYKILLCHHPEYWCLREPMLRDRKIDLVLSGHAHGGQWRFWGRGVFAPGQGLFPEYTSGIHYGQDCRMIISRGLSNPYRFIPRFGNPCEVVYVKFEG